MRAENVRPPKPISKGLNFLLNEQQDKAIDAFIEAVQNDPDTPELHFALGNLFRRRGEYNRAVRVHEHLLSRADLSRPDRDRAQHALAQDFLKAGLLDRAEEALHRLDGTQYEGEARLALLAIYERSRDWAQAAAIVRKMQAAGQGDFSTRLAHYLCEDAQAQVAHGQLDKAFSQLQQALETAPQAPRPRLELAQLQPRQGESRDAFASLKAMAQNSPSALPLAANLLVEVAEATGLVSEARSLLLKHYEQAPSLDLLQALVTLDQKSGDDAALGRLRLVQHLEHEPSLVAAAQWLEGETLTEEQYHGTVQKALNHATKPLTRYRCAACGFEARTHFWHCPGCQSWDSYPARRVEEL